MERIESPRADDSAIEAEIKAKGLTAPRVTPANIEAEIVGEHYFTAGDGVVGVQAVRDAKGLQPGDAVSIREADVPGELELLTFCVLVLRNGFTVTGESACASPENFDADVGRKIARANAVNKIWPLLGFRLKDRLYEVPRWPQLSGDY